MDSLLRVSVPPAQRVVNIHSSEINGDIAARARVVAVIWVLLEFGIAENRLCALINAYDVEALRPRHYYTQNTSPNKDHT